MSEQSDSLQKLAHDPLFWPCAVTLVLAVLLALIPGVPSSLEVLAGAVLVLLLAAMAGTK